MKTIKEAVDNKNNIEGIFNYCDRWCERCPLTMRCAVFATETELMAQKSNSSDSENIEFWNHLTEMLTTSIEMLMAEAEKRGFSFNDLPETSSEETYDNNSLKNAAFIYGTNVSAWLMNNNEFLQNYIKTLEISGNTNRIKELNDAIEVIMFYMYFIGAKIRRALMNTYNETGSDKLGSAKIGLIAIERSIAAFMVLYAVFPELEDDILNFLITLNKIKKQTEMQLPGVWNFVRPGFDELL